MLDFIDMERHAHRGKGLQGVPHRSQEGQVQDDRDSNQRAGSGRNDSEADPQSLGRTLYEPCFFCDGTGLLQSKETVCHEIFRQMRRERDSLPGYKILISAHPAVCDMLEREEKASVAEAARRFQRRIELKPRNDYHLEQFDLTGV